MQFETKYELGDTIYYFDKDISSKIIKAKIIFIECNAKFDTTTQKWICYTIEWKNDGRVCTRSSTREEKLMTKEEAILFFLNLKQEEADLLFERGEE